MDSNKLNQSRVTQTALRAYVHEGTKAGEAFIEASAGEDFDKHDRLLGGFRKAMEQFSRPGAAIGSTLEKMGRYIAENPEKETALTVAYNTVLDKVDQHVDKSKVEIARTSRKTVENAIPDIKVWGDDLAAARTDIDFKTINKWRGELVDTLQKSLDTKANEGKDELNVAPRLAKVHKAAADDKAFNDTPTSTMLIELFNTAHLKLDLPKLSKGTLFSKLPNRIERPNYFVDLVTKTEPTTLENEKNGANR